MPGPPAATPPLPPTPTGANVAGYLHSELGIGQGARLLVAALDAASLPVAPVQALPLPPQATGVPFHCPSAPLAPYPVSILHVNGEAVPGLRHHVPELFEGKATAGYWWWELEDAFPSHWRAAFEHLDEIWVGTEFVRRALEPHVPLPVVKVGMPVHIAPPAPLTRAQLGLPDGFVFLFVFDFFSDPSRKNPLGLIAAFAQAFAPGSGVSLVIKHTNGHAYPDALEALREAAAAHADVHLADRFLPAQQHAALFAAADCYVSLHRSEGFGYPLAEAMYLGRPAIATGYGGNLEFMNEGNSWLVDHTRVRVSASGWPYTSDGTWAEPDLESAARAMREAVANPAATREVGVRAAADVRRTNGLAVVAAAMSQRIEFLASGGSDSARAALGAAGWWRAGDPEALGAARTGLRRAARRVVLRAMRPYTAYQGVLDAALVETAERTLDRLDRVERAHAEALAELRRLRDELAARDATAAARSVEHLEVRSAPPASPARADPPGHARARSRAG